MSDDTACWEDKYLRLRTEKQQILKKCNDLDDAYRQARARCIKLEKNVNRRKPLSPPQSHNTNASDRRSAKETDDLVADLFKRNDKMKKEHKSLQEKHKSAVRAIKKYKKEVQSLKQRYRVKTESKIPSAREDGCKRGTHSTSHECGHSSSDIGDVLGQLQQRLIDTEKMADKINEENERLRSVESHSFRPPLHEFSDNNTSTSSPLPENALMRDPTKKNLRDTTTKLNLLQARYESLESRAKAQSEIQKQALAKLEQQKAVIRQLRYELEDARHSEALINVEANKAEEQKEHVHELTNQNRYLEQQLTQLCEAPFHFATKQAEKERKIQLQAEEIESLQHKFRDGEYRSLCLKKEMESLRNDCDKYRQKTASKKVCDASQNVDIRNDIDGNQGNFQAGEVEQALVSAERNQKSHGDDEARKNEEAHSITKEHLHQSRNVHREAIKDLEIRERMLNTQVLINGELQAQLKEAVDCEGKASRSLQQQVEKYRSIAQERFEQIQNLEKLLQYKVDEQPPCRFIRNDLAALVIGGNSSSQFAELVAQGEEEEPKNLMHHSEIQGRPIAEAKQADLPAYDSIRGGKDDSKQAFTKDEKLLICFKTNPISSNGNLSARSESKSGSVEEEGIEEKLQKFASSR